MCLDLGKAQYVPSNVDLLPSFSEFGSFRVSYFRTGPNNESCSGSGGVFFASNSNASGGTPTLGTFA